MKCPRMPPITMAELSSCDRVCPASLDYFLSGPLRNSLGTTVELEHIRQQKEGVDVSKVHTTHPDASLPGRDEV